MPSTLRSALDIFNPLSTHKNVRKFLLQASSAFYRTEVTCPSSQS